MKKQVILFLLLLPMLQVVANPPTEKILFIDGHLSQVEQLAATEGKLYLVHFTAQWCMPCQWMEKNTFNNADVAQFANDNYLAVRIDIDQPEGQTHKQEFTVTNLPTILIFNSKGQLKDRWETSLDAEQLLQILRKHNIPENRQSNGLAVIQTEILDSPRPVFASVLSPPQPDFIATAHQNATYASYHASITPQSIPTPVPTPLEENFGIQVGVFSSYNNAVGEVMRLEQKINQPVHLASGTYEGRQIFKVIVGRFSNRTLALAYLSQLRRHSINGIIRELSTLEH